MSYVEVEYEMSERHACRLLGMGRSTYRYRARKAERDMNLRARLKELAAKRMRFAQEALLRIVALYKVEDQIRGKPPQERRAVRQAKSKPLLDSLRQWLETTSSKLSRKSDTTAAIRYALSRWDALTCYIEDGHIEIDNNAAERSLRGVALGRKNYLFAGSDAGGERAAAIYSLIGSAKLNGLDPEAYLRQVMTRIADHPINRIKD